MAQREQIVVPSERFSRYVELHEAYHDAVDELCEFLDMAPDRSSSLELPGLYYYQSEDDEQPSEAPIPFGPPGALLSSLKEFVKEASSRTGFEEAELVAYVLTGRPPRLHRVLVSETTRGPVSEVVITIRAPNPTHRDFDSAYGHLKEDWQQSKNRSIFKDQDYQLWEAVESLDGPESWESRQAFWEAVSKKLAEQGRPRTPEAASRCWRRMQAKNPGLNELEESSFNYPEKD